jgi:MFS family permease
MGDAPTQAEAAPAARVRDLLLDRRYQGYVLAILFLGYVVNVMDRSVLSVLLGSIKREFGTSDTLLGVLTGLPFAFFYSTLGLPLGIWADRTRRRTVLAFSVALWSVMTALCGLAGSFAMLLLARIGTAVGEAGGTPPSHALISDYFPISRRATALSIYALGVPAGAMLGSYLGGVGNDHLGWRETFVLVGLPGVLVALLVRFTIIEPPRGHADGTSTSTAAQGAAPDVLSVLRFLWRRPAFRHMCLATGLHSAVWYSGSGLNALFFQNSHHMTATQAGAWTALFSAVSAVGTFAGGWLADRMSVRWRDRRWYMLLPGYATLAMVPFQFTSYLPTSLAVVIPSFCVMMVLASFFFGPTFAMSQALATFRMRAQSTALVLLVQTLLGQGIGPVLTGIISDHLKPTVGIDSLKYGLVIVGLINLWAAGHYFLSARTLREDLDATAQAVRGAA